MFHLESKYVDVALDVHFMGVETLPGRSERGSFVQAPYSCRVIFRGIGNEIIR
jgi:hypothetical protein